MKAMKGTLTEKNVWEIVNYLRSIGPTPAAAAKAAAKLSRVRSALVVSALILAGSIGCRMFDPASQPASSRPRRCLDRAPASSRPPARQLRRRP